MYAQLANEGFVVADYTAIKTFGQLAASINGSETADTFAQPLPPANYSPTENKNEASIGVDIENISSMPVVNDFREDAFYKMNFAPAEMAHCILQPNPYSSFAGLFAAKEAIIKADNFYKNKPFNALLIGHLPEGKPIFPGFQISISHTAETAIAVAVKNNPSAPAPAHIPHNNSFLATTAAVAAFLLSLLTLILFLCKSC
jgi:phosphopantetheinyl transferase (holo-ACP synthase)